MGLYFRRSMNLGPFRVNVSRSGVGWSVGGRGLRVGQSSRGRRYTTISAPGTGLGYRSSNRGCVVAIAALGGAPLVAFLLARAAWPLI